MNAVRRDAAMPANLTNHARKNWVMWQATSDAYDAEHAGALSGDLAMAWGLWRVPESQLHILRDVARL
jgi:hypothetical protein